MGGRQGRLAELGEEDIVALAASSGLTHQQVEQTFQQFLFEHPDGKLGPRAFREMMAKALPKRDASRMEKHVFRMYDTDGSGTIEFPEFLLMFHIMAEGTPEQVLHRIFRGFDANSDGFISVKEIWIDLVFKEMKKLVKDIHGLVKAENPGVAADAVLAQTAFREMDKDADGKVSQEEFVSACLGQEEISKLLALKIIDIFAEEN